MALMLSHPMIDHKEIGVAHQAEKRLHFVIRQALSEGLVYGDIGHTGNLAQRG